MNKKVFLLSPNSVDELNPISCNFDSRFKFRFSKVKPCRFFHSDETKDNYFIRIQNIN